MPYTAYMKKARDTFLPLKEVVVLLPPIKSDCTCLGEYNEFSLLNSPPVYCNDCDNKGYFEAQVDHTVYGTLLDYASESGVMSNYTDIGLNGEFDMQRYALHVDKEDSLTAHYNNEVCFKYSKEVIIDEKHYRILAYDISSLLNQIRVLLAVMN